LSISTTVIVLYSHITLCKRLNFNKILVKIKLNSFKRNVQLCSILSSNIKHVSIYLTIIITNFRGRHGRDRMVVGLTTTCSISTYPHQSCEFKPGSWRGVLDTTLCDKVCQ
jgi:hypothetical protein